MKEYQYKLGCFMTVYNRPDLLIDSIGSILKCHNLSGVKFVIVDDCSPGEKIGRILEGFAGTLRERNNTVVFIKHAKNYGKAEYDKTLRECFNELSDCEFVMPLPPDFTFNPHIFDMARHCFQFINGKVRAITFSIDARFEISDNQINHNKADENFSYTRLVDWGPGIFAQGFIQEFLSGMTNLNSREGTGTTHTIFNTVNDKGYYLYQYRESLCQHMGNMESAMNPEYRRELPLINCRVNLNDKPEILKGTVNKTEYIPSADNEWENKLENLKEWKKNNLNAKQDNSKFNRCKWFGLINIYGKVLDIGCGHEIGYADYQEHHEACEWQGIDPAYEGDGIIKCKAEKMPFPDRYFDYAFMISVLQHVENPELVINECNRVMKQNAILYASVYCNPVNKVFTYEFNYDSVISAFGRMFRILDSYEIDRTVYIKAKVSGKAGN